jgi:DNA-binding response OmpR family regulator
MPPIIKKGGIFYSMNPEDRSITSIPAVSQSPALADLNIERVEVLDSIGELSPIKLPYSFSDGHITCEDNFRDIRINDKVERVTRMQARLLAILGNHAGKIVTRELLAQTAWNVRTVDEDYLRTLKAHVCYVRRKLGPELGEARTGAIRSLYSVGYIALETLRPNKAVYPQN